MKKSLFTIVTGSVLLATAGLASAQSTTTTTTTWTNDQGAAISNYSTTQQYKSFSDPTLHPTIGMELPGTVMVYPLPGTMNVPSSENYSYGIVNDHPIVVERTTRKVVHSW